MAVYFVCFLLTLLLLRAAHIAGIWTRTKHFISLASDCFGIIKNGELDDESKEDHLKENLRKIVRSWSVVAGFILVCIFALTVFSLLFGLGIEALSDILLIASGCLAALAYAIWTRFNAR